MTKDDIMKLAREAGWDAHHAAFDTRIEAFYNLVAAAELRRLHESNTELLIAMQKIAASSADEFGSYYTNRGNIAAARAAIAKAEGGAA